MVNPQLINKLVSRAVYRDLKQERVALEGSHVIYLKCWLADQNLAGGAKRQFTIEGTRRLIFSGFAHNNCVQNPACDSLAASAIVVVVVYRKRAYRAYPFIQ